MLRGEVYWAVLDPAVGSEAAKVRPVVIVSSNGANAGAIRSEGVVTVVPLTSNTEVVHPFQVLVESPSAGLTMPSKAQAEQVRSVSLTRLQGRLGFLDPAEIRRLDAALRLHLSLG
ncbi:MAG TPA: type II toxin-antitoxin system PemK/MazF family toxin [Candidatus Nanopelagicales bacterium]|nr:type II toxin-antitoxin system PemK/MazF family toxin [Candidatus Nanopelagicales bacterium]